MRKFKEGERVKLIKHSQDTQDNLDIGYEGVVVNYQDGDICVRWDKSKLRGGKLWWVEAASLKLIVHDLENK